MIQTRLTRSASVKHGTNIRHPDGFVNGGIEKTATFSLTLRGGLSIFVQIIAWSD